MASTRNSRLCCVSVFKPIRQSKVNWCSWMRPHGYETFSSRERREDGFVSEMMLTLRASEYHMVPSSGLRMAVNPSLAASSICHMLREDTRLFIWTLL
ncbi:unnamed protein product [Somion occarium]|uniref:Uncharacterized protein n=1 Tax=Somion occarium TaxID=3059160 RepID=A0ABP1DZ65_9APHY